MCIIADVVKKVSSTKIVSIDVGYTSEQNPDNPIPLQFVIYSAKVESMANSNAFILPVYNPTNNPEKIIPVDMSKQSEFINKISTLFDKWFHLDKWDSKNMKLSMTNSYDGESYLQVFKVGDYKFSIMPHKSDFGRLDQNQLRVDPSAKVSIDAHSDNYSFIVCQFFRRGDLELTPFGYLCPQKSLSEMLVPTIHGHPHQSNVDGLGRLPNMRFDIHPKGDFENSSEYDHVIYCIQRCSDGEEDNKSVRVEKEDYSQLNRILKEISKDYRNNSIRLHIPKNIIPTMIEINGIKPNRNLVVSTKGSYFSNDLILRN